MNTMYTMVWVSYVTLSLVCGVLPGRGQQESCASKPVCGKPVPSGSILSILSIVPPTVIVKCVVCTPVPQHLSSDTTAQRTGGRVHIYQYLQYLDIGISRPELCHNSHSAVMSKTVSSVA